MNAATTSQSSTRSSLSGFAAQIGLRSEQGRRPDNQDFAAAATPKTAQGLVVAAAADGAGGGKGGRVAAELVVRGFIEGCLGQRDVDKSVALREILALRRDAQETAHEIVERALASAVGDTSTVLIVDIVDLPNASFADIEPRSTALRSVGCRRRMPSSTGSGWTRC